MTASPRLIEQLTDGLRPLGPVAIRRMFGGAGVFLDGLMFGLIDDDVLFLKVDDDSRGDFEAEDLPAFSYATKAGRHTLASYRRAPDRLLDDVDELLAWAGKAYAAARRASATGKGKGKAKGTTKGRTTLEVAGKAEPAKPRRRKV